MTSLRSLTSSRTSNGVLLHGETLDGPGIRLTRSALVMTDRGEADASPGDYLVVTSTGRQLVLNEGEYRGLLEPAPVASDAPVLASAPDSPPVENERAKPGLFGALVRRRAPAPPAESPAPKRRVPALPFLKRKRAGSEVSESITSSQTDTAAPVLEAEPPADEIAGMVGTVAALIMDQDDESGGMPEGTTETQAPAPTPAVTSDPRFTYPTVGTTNPTPLTVKPVPEKKPYDPLTDLENLVIPKRRPGAFKAAMRPGPVPKKAKAQPAVMALLFGKKKAKVAEKRVDLYPWVQPEWI